MFQYSDVFVKVAFSASINGAHTGPRFATTKRVVSGMSLYNRSRISRIIIRRPMPKAGDIVEANQVEDSGDGTL
jgi:hypothetical protein